MTRLIVPVNPQIAKILARYPLPNDPQGPYGARTYATSSKVTTVSDQFSVRLDHRISDKSQTVRAAHHGEHRRADDQPESDCHRSEFRSAIHRSAAQRGNQLHSDAFVLV